MRIVGGKYKGRIFHPGKQFRARPTTDHAKEGLFNILHNRYDFSELKVLDLFSGTGSISYEFASRGCEDITLVEMDFKHFQFILKVIHELEISCIRPVKANVFVYLKRAHNIFDIVFADPPYEMPDLEKIPELIFSSQILKPNGIFILEHPKRTIFNKHEHFQELRRYGNVHFSFFGYPQ